jgi:hypothetical protein
MNGQVFKYQNPLIDIPAFRFALGNHRASQKALSVVIVETIFFATMLVLGIHAPLTILAQQLGLRFQTYLFLSPLITLFCLIVVIMVKFRDFKNIKTKDYNILGWLCLMGIACSLAATFTHVYFIDDRYYIPNVVYFLEHSLEPMDFKIHFLVGSFGNPIISYNQGTSLAYDYFRGVIAYYTHVNYMTIYYSSKVGIAFLVPLAHFLLLNRFVHSPKRALIGTLIAIALIMVSVDGFAFGFSVSWTLAEGKRFFLIIGIPLFVAYTISFLKRPTTSDWFSLLLTCMALVGMTASAINLLAVLAFILVTAFFLTVRLETGHLPSWKRIAINIGLYFSSLSIYIVPYAALLYIQLKRGVTVGDVFSLYFPNAFFDQLSIFIVPHYPLYPLTIILMVVTPVALVFMIKGWKSKFVFLWSILLMIFFLNPLVAPFIMNTVVVQIIYWRLFFLAPYPLAGSLIAATLPTSRRWVGKIAYGAFALAFITYFIIIHLQGNLSFFIYDVRSNDFSISQKVLAIAPKGIMLAPTRLNGLIPMIDSFHPQLVTGEDGNDLWLSGTDKTVKECALRFIDGNMKYISYFAQLVKEQDNLKSVIVHQSVLTGNKALKVEAILESAGFAHKQSVGAFVLFWKQE